MSEEGYKPSEEEMMKAEEAMTDEQKGMSEGREWLRKMIAQRDYEKEKRNRYLAAERENSGTLQSYLSDKLGVEPIYPYSPGEYVMEDVLEKVYLSVDYKDRSKLNDIGTLIKSYYEERGFQEVKIHKMGGMIPARDDRGNFIKIGQRYDNQDLELVLEKDEDRFFVFVKYESYVGPYDDSEHYAAMISVVISEDNYHRIDF